MLLRKASKVLTLVVLDFFDFVGDSNSAKFVSRVGESLTHANICSSREIIHKDLGDLGGLSIHTYNLVLTRRQCHSFDKVLEDHSCRK